MNSDHLREKEGNIIDICSIYITEAYNIVMTAVARCIHDALL